MMTKFLYLLKGCCLGALCCLSAEPLLALTDTSGAFSNSQTLDEVTAISSRFSTLSADRLPYEIKAFTQATIRNSASVGLAEFLREQANIFVSGNPSTLLGASEVQMMGLSSAYIQVLEDGQPVIGREGGSLNIQRIPSFFISKMEITKGAMSTIYGDNALAGVISISTIPDDKNRWEAAMSGNTLGKFSVDVGGNFKLNAKNKFNASLDYEGFGGYDADPSTRVNSIDPYASLGGRVHWVSNINSKHTLRVIARGYINQAKGPYDYGNVSATSQSEVKDYNLSAEWKYNIVKDKLELKANIGRAYYNSWFSIFSENGNNTNNLSSSSQTLENWRPFVLARWNNFNGGTLALGSDIDLQTLNSDRYAKEEFRNNFAVYAQQEWSDKHWTVIGGLRLDIPSSFASQISPKLGVQYSLDKWKFNASFGMGYRSPDLRQQFMFFNHTDLGYYVIGSNILKETLTENFGFRQSLVDSLPLSSLNAERSFSYQVGVTFTPHPKHCIKVWAYRNEVENMIQTYTLRLTFPSASNSIYSYRNVSRVYTQGVDIDYSYQISPTLRLAVAYSFLQAKDPDAEADIAKGSVIAKSESGVFYRVKSSQYRGLFLVPHHLLSVSLNGDVKQWFSYQVNFRWQGETGWQDKDGSGYFDNSSELAPAIYNLDVGFRKEFGFGFPKQWKWGKTNKLSVQIGAKNILNQVAASYLPTVLGINFYLKFYISIF